MAFLTGLSYQNIIDREPALADFDSSYTTTFQTRIDEAKAVLDNRLRAMGYDLDRLGKKEYFFQFDNTATLTDTATLANVESGLRLLVLQTGTPLDTITVVTSDGVTILSEAPANTAAALFSYVMPNFDGASITCTITNDTAMTASKVLCYLTDPALYFVHLYKALELIYESFRANVGDLFEVKSKYYNELYEREFANLVTYYDADNDGKSTTTEMRSIKQTRILR